MLTEKYHEGIRYTFSNENLQIGDKVFPIADGRVREDGSFILHNFSFEDYSTGFPDEPHTIIDLKHSDYKPYEVRTEYGYSPAECYYKIIKKEHQITENPESLFKRKIWVEIQ